MNVWPTMVAAPLHQWCNAWTPWAPSTVVRVLQVWREKLWVISEISDSYFRLRRMRFLRAKATLKALKESKVLSAYYDSLCFCTGYEGNGKTCTQTNICATNNGGCYPLATCTSSPGNTHTLYIIYLSGIWLILLLRYDFNVFLQYVNDLIHFLSLILTLHWCLLDV